MAGAIFFVLVIQGWVDAARSDRGRVAPEFTRESAGLDALEGANRAETATGTQPRSAAIHGGGRGGSERAPPPNSVSEYTAAELLNKETSRPHHTGASLPTSGRNGIARVFGFVMVMKRSRPMPTSRIPFAIHRGPLLRVEGDELDRRYAVPNSPARRGFGNCDNLCGHAVKTCAGIAAMM
jgi:hypothetical protein